MALHMYDLPSTPRFPVYGLAPAWAGLRWLTLWNDRERLWTVSLGHGALNGPDTVVVTTNTKTQASPGLPRIGLADAASIAAAHLASGLPREEEAAFTHAACDDPDASFETLAGSGWSVGVVTIDGRSVQALARSVDDRWALIAETPTVVVAVTGGAGAAWAGMSLVDVRHRLSDYV